MIDQDNEYRMSIKELREAEGLTKKEFYGDYLKRIVIDSVAPALCTEGCEVEPDGTCEHDCPSVLIALGVI